MKRWLVAAVAVVGLTGCASPVAGRAVAGPTTSAAAGNPEVVRWVNNYCAMANYLVASAGVTLDQEASADPATAKKSVSDSLGRVVDVLDVALHDLEGLTPAPTPAADTAVEVVSEPLTRARDKFVSAKATVDGAAEMTPDVFSTVIQDMTEAVTVMQEGVEKIGVVSLPDEYRDAAEHAEECGS
ncbi:hypothetical protein [Saccharothrix hoggarensis]|uniref:Lipoprotein n=1 Tax=Saccharothrix hoggarensis TaxID=913853 RepID=A0ABW3QZE7_9PSEU